MPAHSEVFMRDNSTDSLTRGRWTVYCRCHGNVTRHADQQYARSLESWVDYYQLNVSNPTAFTHICGVPGITSLVRCPRRRTMQWSCAQTCATVAFTALLSLVGGEWPVIVISGRRWVACNFSRHECHQPDKQCGGFLDALIEIMIHCLLV